MSLWNSYHEELLKKWSQMSKTYSIMHSLCEQYYIKWNRILGIPVVIIGGATASSIFSSANNNSSIWTYLNGGLTLIVSTLAGISHFIGITEKIPKHQVASFKYTKIGMDIDTMLTFTRKERTKSPDEFIHQIKTAMLNVREDAPEVLSWVLVDYLKRFDESLTNVSCSVNSTEVVIINSRNSPELRDSTGDGLLNDKSSLKIMDASHRLQKPYQSPELKVEEKK